MSKKKQEKLPGMPDINGKVLDTTYVFVNEPKRISNVEVRLLDDGKYRVMTEHATGDGVTIEDAIKAFKRSLKRGY